MKDRIRFRLKEFYILEKFQVKYYESQLSTAESKYYRKAFEKMMEIEQGHVDFFVQELNSRNIDIPAVTGTLADMAGNFLGESVELTGPSKACTLGAALENRAIEMYQSFTMEAKNDACLQDKLMEFCLEEEFHSLWLQNYAWKLDNKTK
ncbi:MAG: demethoxyubiquinone hydroxylase family protein [Desulfitobacteriaceae bacterium]|nr:demethoxyubiquinone hydroxylase family protein [Desulfitobacteriaceae bacterium]MDD4346866.1 demethoxyubiquinone hydroxylase family protein [Desulfitobacteriaceae bacterium]MDD4402365.1 demethoxyubiquinone hydroxylase family protein [Desulfitobacteriaceae bacterium]